MGFDILSPAAAAAAAGGFDSTATARLYDDFYGDLNVFTSTASGTGSGVQASSFLHDKDHPGNIRLKPGTTNSGYAVKASPQPFEMGNGFTYRTSIQVIDISTSAQEYALYLGLKQSIVSGSGTHGIYFLYDRAVTGINWFAVADDDTGTTSTDTSVAVVEDAWIELAIVMNEGYTSCAYYINGALVATNATVANFPDTGVDDCYALAQTEKSVGTTDRPLYVDYILYDGTVSR